MADLEDHGSVSGGLAIPGGEDVLVLHGSADCCCKILFVVNFYLKDIVKMTKAT